MNGRSSLPQDSTNLPLLMSMRGAGNNASVLLKGVNKVMIDFCDLSIGVSIIVVYHNQNALTVSVGVWNIREEAAATSGACGHISEKVSRFSCKCPQVAEKFGVE